MDQTTPYIRSLNGNKITFLDIQRNQIKIESILLHLAKSCRYNGMIDGWYSNAEHSIHCCRHASNQRVAKAALIHDFGEVVMGDVPGPVKRQFPEFRRWCHEVQDIMYWHFLGTSADISPEVKEIDKRMEATEMLYLRNNDTREDCDALPYPPGVVEFHKWEWREAYDKLKYVFYLYFPDYKDAV